ncbi:MAG TPA: hypothetical protein VJU83_08260 [Burkholderiales bacterium]|nr:hypothetical protein [Burkholderiales bacterium]
MKVFDRLSGWISRPNLFNSQDPNKTMPMTTMSREIEELSWGMLLDDMDRFARSFDKSR